MDEELKAQLDRIEGKLDALRLGKPRMVECTGCGQTMPESSMQGHNCRAAQSGLYLAPQFRYLS